MTVHEDDAGTSGPDRAHPPVAPRPPDPLDPLAASALSTASASAAARAVIEATELQALATLVGARREQALAEDPHADLEQVEASVAVEVSLQLCLSPGVARARLVLAEELVHRRPATLAALQEGRIDVSRARVVCDAVRRLPPGPVPEEHVGPLGGHRDLPSAVEAEALRPGSVPVLADATPGPAAGRVSVQQLRSRLGRLVARADAAGAAARHEAALTRRRCTLRPLEDGMALLQVVGAAPQLHAAWQVLDSTARRLRRTDGGTDALDGTDVADEVGEDVGDDARAPARGGTPRRRTLDQARADALVGVLLGDPDSLVASGRVRVELAVVAPAATVLASGRAAGEPVDPFEEPGLLLGLTGGPLPLPGPVVRELAADARWRRWVTDPCTGHLTGVSSTTYRPAALARFVRSRDGGCGLSTCGQTLSSRLDADHVVPWPHGPTHHTNLHDACRSDHLAKHADHAGGRFRVEMAPDGTVTWTTPTGARHTRSPACWGRARDVPAGGDRAAPACPDDPDPPPF
ncbi:HNH endonuclease [Aquipuribacter sp. SD81]|uniref:HNH endonuclease n=1 Tax=Aquipuribacter sp. SD81 TaxID=3127703 RepID=UPI003015F86B